LAGCVIPTAKVLSLRRRYLQFRCHRRDIYTYTTVISVAQTTV